MKWLFWIWNRWWECVCYNGGFREIIWIAWKVWCRTEAVWYRERSWWKNVHRLLSSNISNSSSKGKASNSCCYQTTPSSPWLPLIFLVIFLIHIRHKERPHLFTMLYSIGSIEYMLNTLTILETIKVKL